jgi:hypothetical protein
MKRARFVLAALPLVAGCSSKNRLPECEQYLARVEKLSRCESLPASDRTTLTHAADQTRQALEDLDTSSSKDVVDEIRRVCRSMTERLKAFPECPQ